MHALLDLFCGTGGFSFGFQSAAPDAFETRLGVDILPDALETFKANHRKAATIRGDIRKLSCKKVEQITGLRRGDVAVIMGGPPCQGFSSIRPFRSSKYDDPRNSLFEQFANFVNYFQPPILLMENVVGLATHRCQVPCDYILRKSYPLFRANEVLRLLIGEITIGVRGFSLKFHVVILVVLVAAKRLFTSSDGNRSDPLWISAQFGHNPLIFRFQDQDLERG